jgi:hypothetical protein
MARATAPQQRGEEAKRLPRKRASPPHISIAMQDATTSVKSHGQARARLDSKSDFAAYLAASELVGNPAVQAAEREMSMSVAIVPTARPGKTGKIVAAGEAARLIRTGDTVAIRCVHSPSDLQRTRDEGLLLAPRSDPTCAANALGLLPRVLRRERFSHARRPPHSHRSDRRGISAQCPNRGRSPWVRPFPPRLPPRPVVFPVNASRRPSRDAAHHSGSGWLARPSPWGTFTSYSSPAFLAHSEMGCKSRLLQGDGTIPLYRRPR